jgi:hypothetical protein
VDDLVEVEKELHRRLLLFSPAQRGALLRLLRLPDRDRADVVARIWASGNDALYGDHGNDTLVGEPGATDRRDMGLIHERFGTPLGASYRT